MSQADNEIPSIPSVDPKLLNDHNNEYRSTFQSFSTAEAATDDQNQIAAAVTDDISGQDPSSLTVACGPGRSNNQIEVVNEYDNGGQLTSVGSIDKSNENENHLLPSRDEEVLPEGYESTFAVDENICREEYSQISLTGKNIMKYKPPPYYLDEGNNER